MWLCLRHLFFASSFVLNLLFDRVVKGGIILIDDYPTEYGAVKAIDEFIKKNREIKINKLGLSYKPSYIVKL